jgi:hypothetical protein
MRTFLTYMPPQFERDAVALQTRRWRRRIATPKEQQQTRHDGNKAVMMGVHDCSRPPTQHPRYSSNRSTSSPTRWYGQDENSPQEQELTPPPWSHSRAPLLPPRMTTTTRSSCHNPALEGGDDWPGFGGSCPTTPPHQQQHQQHTPQPQQQHLHLQQQQEDEPGFRYNVVSQPQHYYHHHHNDDNVHYYHESSSYHHSSLMPRPPPYLSFSATATATTTPSPTTPYVGFDYHSGG